MTILPIEFGRETRPLESSFRERRLVRAPIDSGRIVRALDLRLKCVSWVSREIQGDSWNRVI